MCIPYQPSLNQWPGALAFLSRQVASGKLALTGVEIAEKPMSERRILGKREMMDAFNEGIAHASDKQTVSQGLFAA